MGAASSPSTEKLIRYTLGSVLLLVALNAFGGGYYGMSGAKNIPTEWLQGTVFRSYFIPALRLFVCVGGSALFAAIAIFRRLHLSHTAAFICSMIMIAWIIVQVILIGYVSWLQPAIIIVAIIIFTLTWLHSKYEY